MNKSGQGKYGWRRWRIRRELKRRGLSLRAFALEIGKAPSGVISVAAGNMKSRCIADALAARVGSTAEEIWPRLYGQVELEKVG